MRREITEAELRELLKRIRRGGECRLVVCAPAPGGIQRGDGRNSYGAAGQWSSA